MKIHTERSCDSKICHGSGTPNVFVFSRRKSAARQIICFIQDIQSKLNTPELYIRHRNNGATAARAAEKCILFTLLLWAQRYKINGAVGTEYLTLQERSENVKRGALPGHIGVKLTFTKSFYFCHIVV